MFDTTKISGILLTKKQVIELRSEECIFVNVYRQKTGQYYCGNAITEEWKSSAFANPRRIYRIRIHPKNPAAQAEGGAA